MEIPKGPFCQSCGMPMDIPDCFGTNVDGTQNNDYCCHCFYDGEFTNPNITLEEMIDLAVSIMVEKKKKSLVEKKKMSEDQKKMSEEKARQISESFIPTLKRWRINKKE